MHVMKYALLAASLLMAACATEPAAQAENANTARDCFRASDASGFNVIDARTVKIHTGPRHEYLLTLDRNASDLTSAEDIAIRARGSDIVCVGNGLGVEIFGGRNNIVPWVVTNVARAPERARERAPATPSVTPPSYY